MRSKKVLTFGKEASDKLLAGIHKLASAVKVTLGPSGQNVLIDHPQVGPFITKDGVTVAQSIILEDPIEDLGAQLVKSVAARTAKEVGDGTTTATILAEALYEMSMTQDGRLNMIEVKRGMDKALELVLKELKKHVIPCKTLKMLRSVATISSNEDKVIGNLVAQVVKKLGPEGTVSIDPSASSDDRINIIDGYTFMQGYMSPYFVNDLSRMEVEYNRPLILITSYEIFALDEIRKIWDYVVQQKRPLIIISNGFSGDALAGIVHNRIHQKHPVCAVRCPGGAHHESYLNDIAVLTGGQLISPDKGLKLTDATPECLGSSEKIIITSKSTLIAGGSSDANDLKMITQGLKDQLKHIPEDSKQGQVLLDRYKKLQTRTAIIHVGGSSELDMYERMARVEDAVFASQSALKEGIVPGGGTALKKVEAILQNNIDWMEYHDNMSLGEQFGITVVLESLSLPFEVILDNTLDTRLIETVGDDSIYSDPSDETFNMGFNVRTREFIDMVEGGIIDPVLVVKSALSNAVSVAGMLATTQCVISETDVTKDKQHDRQQMLASLEDQVNDGS